MQMRRLRAEIYPSYTGNSVELMVTLEDETGMKHSAQQIVGRDVLFSTFDIVWHHMGRILYEHLINSEPARPKDARR